MSLRTLTHDFHRFFGLKFEKTISSFRNKYAIYNIAKNEYVINGNNILFKKLNLEIPASLATPILERYQNALNLVSKGNFTFFLSNEELYVRNEKLEFRINDEEELFILTEVFLEGSYNLVSPTKKKIALIDVGMNVGITTLFYASKENVDKVFSFEPFVPTFSMAQQNVKLNKKYSDKIEVNNFGLAKEDSELKLDYSTTQKGRMGIGGLPKSAGYIAAGVSQQKVHLKKAANEFSKIKNKISNHFVVCKIDCEGAEYEIIDSLNNSNLISFVDVYFIEWHEINPSSIVSSLVSNNYNVIETSFRLLNTGMIYAIKKDIS